MHKQPRNSASIFQNRSYINKKSISPRTIADNVPDALFQELLKGKQVEYGEKIVVSLSRQLVLEYGNSFSEKNLRRMMQFAYNFIHYPISIIT